MSSGKHESGQVRIRRMWKRCHYRAWWSNGNSRHKILSYYSNCAFALIMLSWCLIDWTHALVSEDWHATHVQHIVCKPQNQHSTTIPSWQILEWFDRLSFLLHCLEYFRTKTCRDFQRNSERSYLTCVITNRNNKTLF